MAYGKQCRQLDQQASNITLLCLVYQGPVVVRSIISLTSSLRGQLVKCFTAL